MLSYCPSQAVSSLLGDGFVCSTSSDTDYGGASRHLSAGRVPLGESSVGAGLVGERLAIDWDVSCRITELYHLFVLLLVDCIFLRLDFTLRVCSRVLVRAQMTGR